MANCRSSYSDPTAQNPSNFASSGNFPLDYLKLLNAFAPFDRLVAEKTDYELHIDPFVAEKPRDKNKRK